MNPVLNVIKMCVPINTEINGQPHNILSMLLTTDAKFMFLKIPLYPVFFQKILLRDDCNPKFLGRLILAAV